MAKRKKSRKVHKAGAKRSSGKGRSSDKGKLPLHLLEKRLKTLYGIVEERGGDVPGE